MIISRKKTKPVVREIGHELQSTALRIRTNDLADSLLGHSAQGTESVGDITEGGSRVVDVARKTDAGGGGEVSSNGKHGDTSVLELDLTEAAEASLTGTVQHTSRVVEAKLVEKR